MKCYVNIPKELYADVVLSSGTTMFQRIVERMTKKNDGVGFTHDDDHGGCSAREKALGMNWRIFLVPLSTFLQ